jgi:hypothetical protein
MKNRTKRMTDDLNNPFMKKFVDALLNPVDDMKTRERSKKVLQGVATAADSALFNLPSKIKPVKNFIDEFRNSNPKLSRTAEIVGDLAGSSIAGGAAVKGLSKVGKLKKVLSGNKWTNTAAKSAAYGLGTEAPELVTKGYDSQTIPAMLRAAAGGYALGGIGHGLGVLIKPIAKSMGIRNPFRKPEKIRDKVGQELYNELDQKTINKAREIISNPIESKNLNLNTLVHRSTEDSKAMADNLYQKSSRAREILEKKYKELAEGQMPFLREKIMETGGLNRLPDTKSFVDRKTRQIKKIVKPMYDKSFEVGDLDAQRKIPLRLRNDTRFEPAVEKAYSEMNLLDKQKPTYEKYSVRNLHDAKEYIGDDIGKFGASGDNKAKARVTETYNLFRDMLNAASPEYEKATGIAKKYFDIQKAAEGGLDFKNQGIEEIAKKLKDFSQHERTAYKTAAVESLLKTAEKRSQNSQLAELGKDFTNAEIKRKLENIIGEENLNQLAKNIEVSNNAVNTLREITKGSGTAKHMSNQTFFRGILGSLKGQSKSITNLGIGAVEHIKEGKAKREAALKMRLLLNPKKLLEFGKLPPKEVGNIVPTLYGIKNKEGNKEAADERERRESIIAARKLIPKKSKEEIEAERFRKYHEEQAALRKRIEEEYDRTHPRIKYK